MDTKNDDSGGSDSLQNSLQKKCVVEDVGEGASCMNETTIPSGQNDGQQQCNSVSAKKQKTEKQVGDGGGGGTAATGLIKKTQQDDNNSPAAAIQATTNASSLETKERISHNSSNTGIAPTTSNTINAINANCNNSGQSQSLENQCPGSTNNAFETKVKQISKNLKETTLAETASTNKEILTDDSASTSSTASNATSPESSEAAGTPALQDNPDDQIVDMDGTPMNSSMVSDSNDDADSRSKKVRFHPDVKENDGGNRVIPKKKKKLKANSGSDDPSANQQQTGGTDDEMDLDEDEELEEDDEFDLAKTIAEAQDYLKEHPLTFVRPCDKSAGRLQNGLLEEEDLPQNTEAEEEFREEVIPENGIERILGKQVKGGRVEFLLRFTNQSGLFWESEDFIATQCPSLLVQYEHNRERRQERLMRHVAKRQNLRQRYTDF